MGDWDQEEEFLLIESMEGKFYELSFAGEDSDESHSMCASNGERSRG